MIAHTVAKRINGHECRMSSPLAEGALTFLDKSLAGRAWLVGEACTIADIGCWGRMVFMAEGGMDIAEWPNVAAWSLRLAEWLFPNELGIANAWINRKGEPALPNGTPRHHFSNLTQLADAVTR